jgi:hypothetical protein
MACFLRPSEGVCQFNLERYRRTGTAGLRSREVRSGCTLDSSTMAATSVRRGCCLETGPSEPVSSM